ncbi:MAG: sugar ABC transporter permease [Lachnospiraceae bacterium]|nr:sugar ABC transporter permease [Lachnospiraceae bacterium]
MEKSKTKKKRLVGLEKRKARAGYLFIMPFIFGFVVFMVRPFVQSLYMSFTSVELGAGIFNMSWTGLANYYYSFRTDPDYVRLLTEELLRMVIYSFAIIVFSFFVSLILNQKFQGRALVRAVFFLPVILSSGVMLGLESNNQLIENLQKTVETTTSGISITAGLQTILRTTGVGTRAFEKVFEVINNIYDVAMASGIQIIIFLSGLQTIPTSMYEAAQIEGCTAWESLWKVTFPMISSLFLVNWVYTVVDFCMRSDNQVIDKIQDMMVVKQNYGTASAMTWVYFVVVIAFVGITSLAISKGVYYND